MLLANGTLAQAAGGCGGYDMRVKIIVICLVFLVCTGCGSKNGYNEEEVRTGKFDIYSPDEVNKLHDENWNSIKRNDKEYNIYTVENLNGHLLQGMVIQNEKIYVCDKEENKILVLDGDGNIVQEVGETGNGEREFLYPVGIAYADGIFYVLDIQNARVQLLSDDLEYVGQIPFDRKYVEGNIKYGSIAVNGDGDIYFSTIGIDCGNILLYKREEGVIIELGENIAGTVALDRDSDKIYVINIGILERDEKISGICTGINYLYEINKTALQAVCELPYGITASGFVVKEDRVFCVSASYSSVDCYSVQGEYLYSLATFQDIGMYSSLAEGIDGRFYLANDKGLRILEGK